MAEEQHNSTTMYEKFFKRMVQPLMCWPRPAEGRKVFIVSLPEPGRKVFGVSLPEPGRKVFGVSLPELGEAGLLIDGVPLPVRSMVEFLRKHALQQVGLFRVNGKVRAVEGLRLRFESEREMDPLQGEDACNTVASLLKQFLRELPGGLITASVQPGLLQLYQECGGDQSRAIKKNLQQLPDLHYNLLKYLCLLLTQVESCHPDNRMTALNLATAFGPSVFHVSKDLDGIKEQVLCNKIMEKLIQNYSTIFESDLNAEDPKENCLNVITAKEAQENRVELKSPADKVPTPRKKKAALSTQTEKGDVLGESATEPPTPTQKEKKEVDPGSLVLNPRMHVIARLEFKRHNSVTVFTKFFNWVSLLIWTRPKVFGVSLLELGEAGLLRDGVPLPVRSMVEFLRKHALQQVGLFRVNGNVRAVEGLRLRFESERKREREMDPPQGEDACNTVASLLKQFLRDVPGGLITASVQPGLLQLNQECGGDQSRAIKEILQKLPDLHYNLLKYLCLFLTEMESRHPDNRMTAPNLATALGPSIFHVSSGLDGIKEQNLIIEKLIQNYSAIFDSDVNSKDLKENCLNVITAKEAQENRVELKSPADKVPTPRKKRAALSIQTENVDVLGESASTEPPIPTPREKKAAQITKPENMEEPATEHSQ